MADVLTFVRDMLFTSKIREVAKQLTVSVAPIRDPASIPALLEQGARLVILDLRLPEALAIQAALSGARQSVAAPVRVVGFIDHERTDVMDAARAAGVDEVMAKGQFANALPRLFTPLASPPAT